jgi:hypothetical protein
MADSPTNTNKTPTTKTSGAVTTSKSRDILEFHREVIDCYYSNGYRKYKAVQEVRPGTSQNKAGHLCQAILKNPSNQWYIEEKRQRLASRTDIYASQVIEELNNWRTMDATDYIGLTIDELKALPAAERRCIQSFKEVTRIEENRKGDEIKTVTIEIKLIDKQRASSDLSKHLGLYEADNLQKREQKPVKLSDFTKEELQLIYKMKQKHLKTIDITPER